MTHKRRFLFLLLLVISLWNFGIAGKVLVDLDTAKLPLGKLERWPNAGTLGGYFSFVTNAPAVARVVGRKSVTFKGKGDFLKASFAAPEAITGERPFTFSSWVFDSRIDGKKVICSWASFATQSAEVGIGRGRNAAFYNSVRNKLGFEGGVPESGKWHHLAVAYDQKTVKVYLDGRLNAEKACVLDIKSGDDVYLGAGWDARRSVAVLPFSGSLAQVRIYDYALTEREVRNLLDYYSAFSPSPENGEAVEDLKTVLRWENGDTETVSFNVYFSTRWSELEKEGSKSPAFKGNFPASTTSFGPVDLAMGQTYYWRVDGVDQDGRVKRPGEIWRFSASFSPAREPHPCNWITAVKSDLSELRWTPGRYAVSQDVFFGESYEQVKTAISPQIKDLAADSKSCRVPTPLEYEKTYYWRVDTDNGDLPTATGEVWSFRVEDKPIDGDVTFFITSDMHYGASVTVAKADKATIDIMNTLPGTPYPKKIGGFVRTPRGVIVPGDLIDEGNAPDAAEIWKLFTDDYGVNGEGRLLYPVYEGAGNHDGDSDKPARLGIKARNLLRPAVKDISPDGLHYSWDWDPVHFVHLNLFPGSAGDDIINPWGKKFEGDWKYPQHSLEFLIDDLARNVGSSGRPVVLLQHYGWDKWSKGWWSENERTAYYDAIKTYHVIAIFWGHSHFGQLIPWNGIPTFCVGSGQNDPEAGEVFVVRITPDEMTVAERKKDGWGLISKIPVKRLSKFP